VSGIDRASRDEEDRRTPEPELVTVGRVSGLFGTRGWLKVHSFTRPRTNLLNYRQWWVGQPGQWRQYEVLEHKVHGTALLASLADVNEREQAVALIKSTIAVPRTAFHKPAPGEYYWSDLLNLAVLNQDGIELGRIKRLVEAGDHDVLVVQGTREYLIPFVAEHYIQSVDFETGVVRVDWHVDD
jgi:16S rRNA processing protein RimM